MTNECPRCDHMGPHTPVGQDPVRYQCEYCQAVFGAQK